MSYSGDHVRKAVIYSLAKLSFHYTLSYLAIWVQEQTMQVQYERFERIKNTLSC